MPPMASAISVAPARTAIRTLILLRACRGPKSLSVFTRCPLMDVGWRTRSCSCPPLRPTAKVAALVARSRNVFDEDVHIKKAQGLRTFFTGVAHTAAHAQEARMTRVLVADDFPLVREALAAALARHPEIDVVGMAGDGIEAVELAHEHQPDVVVLDLRMPRMSG